MRSKPPFARLRVAFPLGCDSSGPDAAIRARLIGLLKHYARAEKRRAGQGAAIPNVAAPHTDAVEFGRDGQEHDDRSSRFRTLP